LRIARKVILAKLSISWIDLGVRIWTKHLTITKHEPHHIEFGIGTVNLVDDFVAHLLVSSIKQL